MCEAGGGVVVGLDSRRGGREGGNQFCVLWEVGREEEGVYEQQVTTKIKSSKEGAA